MSKQRFLRAFGLAALCSVAAACTGGAAKKPEPLPADKVGRPVLTGAADALSLQGSVMALADTSIQRIGAGLAIGSKGRSIEARREDTNTRLILASALVAIAMQPDAVDALADMLTHTTLTSDAQRRAAEGKASDSPEAKLLVALEQNDADAWRLAERWLNEPTRVAFRAHILDWPGPRTSAASVA